MRYIKKYISQKGISFLRFAKKFFFMFLLGVLYRVFITFKIYY